MIQSHASTAWLACVLIGSVAGTGRGAETAGDLREIAREAASAVVKVVGRQAVQVGQISETGLRNSNGGPAIGELLRQELVAMKAAVVDKDGAFEVKGDYLLKKSPIKADADQGIKAVTFSFRVINLETSEAVEAAIPRFLRDNASIARLAGISGTLPLDPTKDQAGQRKERNLKIQELIKDPRSFVDPARPSLVSSAKGSPYRVEVVAGTLGDGKARPTVARPAVVKDGLAFVKVDQGEVYEIRLYNASPDEVAARIFIDGLDVFHFSDNRDPKDPSRPRYSHFIVPGAKGGKEVVEAIPGWHKALTGQDNFLSFLVTAYGQGAASKEGVSASGPVGVIQVQFSKTKHLPPDALPRSAANETGFGPPRHLEQAELRREVEPAIDFVSIRYTR